jgi:hypothetical protein
MSTIAQAQFLRIYTTAGTTRYRWQAYFSQTAISLGGGSWTYRPFESSGITAGQTGDEGGVTLTFPALTETVDAIFAAIPAGHLFELTIYSFPPSDFAARTTAATFTGEIVGSSATLTSISVELGSALAPVGAQIPPRTITTRLIGKGCRL